MSWLMSGLTAAAPLVLAAYYAGYFAWVALAPRREGRGGPAGRRRSRGAVA
jgi:hypothetical protein